MNKKLITLAVAAAMVAPLAAVAETTLYGRIDVSLNNDDVDSVTVDSLGNVTAKDNTADGWDMRNETTRIGVKGSEDLGNGIKAIFQAEWAFEGVEGGSYASEGSNTGSSSGQRVFRNRLAYAGLSGAWGTAAMGRQWTPYYGAVNKTDVYNRGDFNPQYLGTTRGGNLISYVTPNWNGFSAAAGLQIDGANNTGSDDEDGVDHYNLAVNYDNGPFSVGGGYLKVKGTGGEKDYKMAGIGGSYTFQEMFKISGQYESGKLPIGITDFDASEWTILGEFFWGNNIFRGSYADYGQDIDDLDDFWALGWQYNFSKRTRVYAEYFNGTAFDRDLITSDINGIGYTVDDGNSWGLGIRHDF